MRQKNFFDFESQLQRLFYDVRRDKKVSEHALYSLNQKVRLFYIKDKFYISLKDAFYVLGLFIHLKSPSVIFNYFKELIEVVCLRDLDRELPDIEGCLLAELNNATFNALQMKNMENEKTSKVNGEEVTNELNEERTNHIFDQMNSHAINTGEYDIDTGNMDGISMDGTSGMDGTSMGGTSMGGTIDTGSIDTGSMDEDDSSMDTGLTTSMDGEGSSMYVDDAYPFEDRYWPENVMDNILSNIYCSVDPNGTEQQEQDRPPATLEQDDGPMVKKYMGRGRCRVKQENVKDRPFICEYQDCKRAFKRYEHLKRHNKMHTGERPYKCKYPGCMKSFSRSDNLAQHYKIHNMPSNPNHSNFRPYFFSNDDDKEFQ